MERLIQVCYRLDNEKTLKREANSLVECAQELHCGDLTIVTLDQEDTLTWKGNTIKVIPITKF